MILAGSSALQKVKNFSRRSKGSISHRFEDVLKILPYCDTVKFFDNNNGFVLVAEYRNGQILPVGMYRPTWLNQLMEQSN